MDCPRNLIGEAIPEIAALLFAAAKAGQVAGKGAQLAKSLKRQLGQGVSPRTIMAEALKTGARQLAEETKARALAAKRAGAATAQAVRTAATKIGELFGPRAGRLDAPSGKLPDGGQKPLSPEVQAHLDNGAQRVEIDGVPYLRDKQGRLWKCASPCEQVPEAGDRAVVPFNNSGVLNDAKYAQTSYSSTFSAEGIRIYSRLAGRPINTIDELVAAIRAGQINPSQIEVNYIVRPGGRTLILNTRTGKSLEQAGIPRSQWNAINRTDDPLYERLLSEQQKRNNLTNSGIANPVRDRGR